jgi:hypothetical protein
MTGRRPFLLALLAAAGCGGDATSDATLGAPATEPAPPTTAEPSTTESPPTTTHEPRALSGLPTYTAGYRSWLKLNRTPIPPRADGDAQLGTKNVFASKRRRDGRFPDGTILVKEAVRPDKDFLGLIAVMRKRQGSNPAHNDWQFLEFTREAREARFSLTARDEVCWSCHMGAEKTDYVWIYTLGLGR